jgi:hypothetical protein
MTVADFLLVVLLLNVSLLGLYLQYYEHQLGTLASPKLQAAFSATLAQALTEVTDRLSSNSIVTFNDPNQPSLAPASTAKCTPLALDDCCSDEAPLTSEDQAPQGLGAQEEEEEQGEAETF